MFVAMLLGVELIDELYSGVPSIGASDIQGSFGASYSVAASVLLFVPGLVALVVEPILFVLADRYPRKWFVCGGLFAMAIAAFIAAAAKDVVVLAAALALACVGSGCGVSLSQATLVDARPHDRERVLTRWVLLGEIGDILAPVLIAVCATASLGWRGAFAIVGAFVLVWALLLARRTFPKLAAEPTATEADAEPGIFAALLDALRHRRLLVWLGATALCDLLDEIVIVFAAMHLRDHFEATPLVRTFVLGAGLLGSVVGVFITDRLLGRVAPLRLLLAASVACAAAYTAWLLAPNLWIAGASLVFVGITAAPMYPIASAQAYAALPGRSGTVQAAGNVYTPVILALPWLLGVVADHAGTRIALAFLLIQPIGVLLVTASTLRARPPRADEPSSERPNSAEYTHDA